MSKPVKELVKKELVRRFEGLDSLAIVGFTGIDAITTHEIRGRLRDKQIRLSVVKNSLARAAFKEIGLPDAKELFDGPCAVAYGTDTENVSVVNVVREVLELGKKTENLTVKAAVLEGEIFGPERVKELSEYPTRDEARSNLVACVLAPGKNLVGCLIGPASTLASLVKAIEEKRESEGEASASAEATADEPAEEAAEAPAEEAAEEAPSPEEASKDADEETKEE